MTQRILLFLTFMLALTASAQTRRGGRGYRQFNTAVKTQNTLSDTLTDIARKYEERLDSMAATTRATLATNAAKHSSLESLDNPYYFPLFAGNTLLDHPIHHTIGSIGDAYSIPYGSVLPSSLESIAWTLAETYAFTPDVVKYNLWNVPVYTTPGAITSTTNVLLPSEKSNTATRAEAQQTAAAPVHIDKGKHEDVDFLDLSDFHIHVRRPNFWTLKGSYSTQFMQYYVSDNWYKGGENHVSMLAAFNFEANYDNKRKLSFSNKLETKLGFQTSPSDTYHKFKTNADLLRLTDKLGIKAWHHWDYTVTLQSWTQFYKAYKANSADVSSDFFSPFEAVLSAGMDYKLSKKRVNLTLSLSPAAANLKYCDRKALVKNYGIEEGKHHKIDLGSTMTMNMTLKFCDQVNWVTRLYAFYDYKHHLKAEWENTINLKINKYLSTKLFLYPRYDNNVKKKNEDDSYFQFNEYLSVGLDLNF